MASDYWLLGMAMMLIVEGLLPLVMPAYWRETFVRLVALNDGQLRTVGLMAILTGLALLYWIN